ncbi:NlpC/P60 family protein [Enterobacter mori]|uniref:NlpC/P60 family protein n=1 Tax=Enterobacter mori TaxID=539813 RepID=UPI003B98038E
MDFPYNADFFVSDINEYTLHGVNTETGIDCSALMQHIFNDVAALLLPRTASEQMKREEKAGRHNLKTGDLIFSVPAHRIAMLMYILVMTNFYMQRVNINALL